jgi:hypothetical protein
MRLMQILLTLALCMTTANGITASDRSNDEVWTWSDQCGTSKQITVELVVDGFRIYRRSIPICVVERNSLPSGSSSTLLVTKRSHFGEPSRTRLETDFWQAGGDIDAVILGVSFASANRVWLNTLHIALPDKLSEAELAKGVVVKTYPTIQQEPPIHQLKRMPQKSTRRR